MTSHSYKVPNFKMQKEKTNDNLSSNNFKIRTIWFCV